MPAVATATNKNTRSSYPALETYKSWPITDEVYNTMRREEDADAERQTRAGSVEKLRRKAFRRLLDKTNGRCAEQWEEEHNSASGLVDDLIEQQRPDHLASVRLARNDRIYRAQRWLKELKEMR